MEPRAFELAPELRGLVNYSAPQDASSSDPYSRVYTNVECAGRQHRDFGREIVFNGGPCPSRCVLVRLYRVVSTIAYFGHIAVRIPLASSCRSLNIALTASRNLPACLLPSNQSSATPGSGCVLVRSGRVAPAGAHPLRSRFSYCPPQPSLSRHCFYSSTSTARPIQPHPTLSSTVPPLRFSTSPPPMVTHMSSVCLSASVLKLTRSASGVGHSQVGDRVDVGLHSLPTA